MKYTRMRNVATGTDRRKWIKCSVCGDKVPHSYLTVDNKDVCSVCKLYDKEVEYVETVR